MSRLIDADALIETLNDNGVPYNADANYFVENAPTIDAVSVVRCGECKHRETCCRPCYKSADSYCSDGEREGE